MADSKTQHRTDVPHRSAHDREVGSSASAGRGRTRGLVSLVAGGLGVVAAILPGLGVVALALAAGAIGAGIPAMRRGPGTPSFASARVGVVLGMIAVLLGFVSLAMQLLT